MDRSSARCSCAQLLSVFTTVGIVVVLALETFEFLREVSIVEFLTGTEWTPLFANPHFGVLPLRGRHAAHLGDRDGWWRCRWACSRRST